MKLRSKLLAAPLMTALVVLLLGQADAWWMTREAGRIQQAFGSQLDDLKTIADAKDQLSHVHASVYRMFVIGSSMDAEKIKDFRASLAAQLQGVKRTIAGTVDNTDTDRALLDAIAAAAPQIDTYLKDADTAVDLASVDPNTGVAAMQTAETAYEQLSQSMGAILARTDALRVESGEVSMHAMQRVNALLGLLALCGAGVAVYAAWLMQRSLVRDLGRAAKLADDVAQGELVAQAPTDRKDEVGDLLTSLGRMAQTLAASIRTVRESADSIRVSATEIASGNLDLSSRTEQAASSLQQTASSMTRLNGTVQHSADSSRQANQLASSAAVVAAKGGQIVSQVVTTMHDINAASRRIGDIIGVIDGIAFQTNILALNAAVEAARAGEQGRGFAVVASEVRSLAQRSAQAAREIKTLIGASVDKVEGGTRLVGDAGQTMDEIVSSVQRVADIIGEITAAATEQAGGINQVNTAVGQLDQMTQQNAALVEQSAAAAESLKQQGDRLASAVAKFRLGDARSAATDGPTGSVLAVAPPVAARPPVPPAARPTTPKATATAQRPAQPASAPPAAHVVEARSVIRQLQAQTRPSGLADSSALRRPGGESKPAADGDWESF